MTSPESIVTSLDWSKKLERAEWPQEQSCFTWKYTERMATDTKYFDHPDDSDEWSLYPRSQKWVEPVDLLDAPTAEEILRRLPGVGVVGDEMYLQAERTTEAIWWVQYKSIDGKAETKEFSDVSLANAAAAMYCYLSEQKLLPTAA